MKNIAGLLYFLLLSFFCQAQQTDSDFFTIKPGPVSELFLIKPEVRAGSEAKSQTVIEEKEAFRIYENAALEIEDLILSGTIYFNDELTTYVQEIVDNLSSNDPSLAGKFRVLISRSGTPNAYCIVDGTIIVSVSLVARLGNVSQLAGILAHELSHYKKKHTLNRLKQGKEWEKQEQQGYNSRGNIVRSLAYSRENEFEADAAAVTWISSTQYDANEFAAALALITLPQIDSLPLDLPALFNTDVFKVDTSIISIKNVKKELKRSTNKNKSFIGSDDEDYSTHPDGEKRVLASREILSSLEYKIPVMPPDQVFEELKRKSEFENCENAFNGGHYLESLHQAMGLQLKYPQSMTATTLTVKNLFWLCRLKENGVMATFMENVDVEKSPSMARLKLFFEKTKSADLGKFLFTYVKREYDKAKDNSDLLFYMAAAAEMHLGKDAAMIHYRAYSVKYPDGKFSTYVSQKLS